MWKNRYLTFEGKSLIIKAFGLSQSIYSLQVLEVRKLCIIRIERSSFGFLWIGCRSEKEKGIDRIKRSVLKNGYECGGLNITDVDCLNISLKLRQFIRANSADHPIRMVQQYCLENCGYSSTIMKVPDLGMSLKSPGLRGKPQNTATQWWGIIPHRG